MEQPRCKTPRCRNNPAGRSFCSTCRKRQSRQRDPVKYSYDNIKNRARQRGKPFTITLEYFAEFCRQYDYIAGKGKTKTSYSVDCIINSLGYVPGNLQILPLGVNASKGVKILSYDWQNKIATVFSPRIEETDLPF